MRKYLCNKLDNTIIYLASLNKGYQLNLNHYILGDFMEILWLTNF